MSKTIMYCPLNDGHIVALIEKFSKTKFKEVGDLDFDVKLQGKTDFQKLICDLPVINIQNSNILNFDKVVADKEHESILDAFWERNQMQLQKPPIPASTPRELYFVAAAIMQLKAKWDQAQNAQKDVYTILKEDSHSGSSLKIDGYQLSKVAIATDRESQELSALTRLDNNVDIRLSDLTAFGNPNEIREKLQSEDATQHLYQMITENKLSYYNDGSLIAPCIEEDLIVDNHLQGINWESEDNLYQVNITSSQALTKLKLNEKGVEARAETVARGEIVFGCSASSFKKHYLLVIKHGLVVDIRYQGQSIFMAYVPQEKFK